MSTVDSCEKKLFASKIEQASRGTMNQHHSALSEILEEKNWKIFHPIIQPKLAKIRPKIGFSQA